VNPSPRRQAFGGIVCILLATTSTGVLVFGHALFEAAIMACAIPLSVAGTILGFIRLKKEKSE
jgi:hypothetical protein